MGSNSSAGKEILTSTSLLKTSTIIMLRKNNIVFVKYLSCLLLDVANVLNLIKFYEKRCIASFFVCF